MKDKDFFQRLINISDAFFGSINEIQSEVTPDFSKLCIHIMNVLIDQSLFQTSFCTTKVALKTSQVSDDQIKFLICLADNAPKELSISSYSYDEAKNLLQDVIGFFDSLGNFSASIDCHENDCYAAIYMRV